VAKNTGARGQGPAASNSDPLNALPERLRPAATRERDLEAQRAAEGLPSVELHADDLDKAIDQKWSENEDEYTRASNPMQDCVNRFKKDWPQKSQGMSFKFFTPVMAGEIGTEDYEVCLDPNGKKYMVGLDWMGMIPTRIAARRRAKALKDSEDQVGESKERFGEGVDKLRREAGRLGLEIKGDIDFTRTI